MYWKVDHIYEIVPEQCQSIEWFPVAERIRRTGWIEGGWWKVTSSSGSNPFADHLYMDDPNNLYKYIKYMNNDTKLPETVDLKPYIIKAKATLREEKIKRILNG